MHMHKGWNSQFVCRLLPQKSRLLGIRVIHKHNEFIKISEELSGKAHEHYKWHILLALIPTSIDCAHCMLVPSVHVQNLTGRDRKKHSAVHMYPWIWMQSARVIVVYGALCLKVTLA